MDASEEILFVAIGCGRLPGMLDVASKRPFVVLGTMDGQTLTGLASSACGTTSEVAVYFYETG